MATAILAPAIRAYVRGLVHPIGISDQLWTTIGTTTGTSVVV